LLDASDCDIIKIKERFKVKKRKLRVIYEPRGRAREYSALAVNLYSGCNHGCKYCYAPDCMRRDRQEFYNKQSARVDILKKIQQDCKVLSGIKERVLLCFTCDPYQKLDDTEQLTRETLKLFRQYQIPFQILTKAGHRAERDFDLYTEKDAFATTLTFMNDEKSLYYEPEAALPAERIETIKKAKQKGIETWVSFEPVLNDEEVYKLLDATHEYVDLYKVGKVSRFKTDKEINWERFAGEIVNRLEALGKKYYIKNDLKKHL
jgi:DNA repair photolyase